MHVLELAGFKVVGDAGEGLIVRDEESQTAEVADGVVKHRLCYCDAVVRACLVWKYDCQLISNGSDMCVCENSLRVPARQG